MKKRIGVVALLVLLAVLTVQGTFAAYNYTSPKVHNVITSGNVSIDLIEKTDKGKPFEDIEDAMPGQEYSKIVTVKNDGYGDAYVRLEVVINIKLKDGKTTTVPASEMLILDINKDKWQKSGGFYYYIGGDNGILESGDTTEPLFTTVTFSPEMDNIYQGGEATIVINAYGVQSKNNEPDSGKVTDVKGWPSNT